VEKVLVNAALITN